jgi:glycosyltransferase involved in cell wall biosynthesis
MSRVSIIIPLHNHEQFVAETLSSALGQTHPDIEVVVVNDASTDSSLRIARSYERRGVKVIDYIKNIGLPAARNVAIRNSTGEFVLPLDSDDWIDSRYVEKTLAKMHDGVGVVATYLEAFGSRPHRVGPPDTFYPIFYPTKEQILAGNCLPVCSLIRRQTLDDVGGYPEEMREGSEDWALWVKIICKTNWRVEIVPEYLFHYRTREGSMSRQATMMPFEQAREKIRRLYA